MKLTEDRLFPQIQLCHFPFKHRDIPHNFANESEPSWYERF